MDSNPTLPVFRFDACGVTTGEFRAAAPAGNWLRALWRRLIETRPREVCIGDARLARTDGRVLWRGRPYSGTLVEVGPDGQLLARYRVRGGWLHGRCERWTGDGRRLSEFRYRKGRPRGLQKMYRPDGSFRANWVDRDGTRRPHQ